MIITGKQAKEMLEMIADNAIVSLDVINIITLEHEPKRIINKEEQDMLVSLANTIQYQDNDFFGVLLMNGINKDKLHNILFPQIE